MNKFSKKQLDICICFLCLLFSFISLVLLVFGLQEDFSERENRALQKLPKLKLSHLANGSFFSKFSDFASDQFPARSFFCSLSSLSELALFRQESNGIIVAQDDYLISRHDNVDKNILSNNLEEISEFLNICDAPSFLLIAPRAIDIVTNKLSVLFYEDYCRDVYNVLNQKISKDKLIDTSIKLKKLSEAGEKIWYRTDHHWTTEGAYQSYLQLGERLGINTYDRQYFNIICATDRFRGTSFSRSALPYFCSFSDSIELYRYNGDENIAIISPTAKKTTYGFYDMNALAKKDKYQVFLGGNIDLLQIRDAIKEKPRMLLIKDSFANSLIPFLSLHYNIDVIDLRHFKASLKNFMESNKFDTILIVYGIDTLCSEVSCSNITK